MSDFIIPDDDILEEDLVSDVSVFDEFSEDSEDDDSFSSDYDPNDWN
jgi:hypothetical protein